MGTTQKYSLKWNDFTVNVASTFGELHTKHDFVDVTLACSDGSTLEAHKVILSSVSPYFRDILMKNPCNHPIVILKDTSRDEAEALLEFAYTGEVHIAQELLPALLHTARCFQIKGLDKVENPIVVETNLRQEVSSFPTNPTWNETFHSNGSDSSMSNRYTQNTNSHADHYRSSVEKIQSPGSVKNLKNLLQTLEQETMRKHERSSTPSSIQESHPTTREGSPCFQHSGSSDLRTPPQKRWKRSFDPNQPQRRDNRHDQPLSLVTDNELIRDDYLAMKYFRRPCPNRTKGSELDRSGLTYSQSMPTSPTMLDRRNEKRLSGLIYQPHPNDLPATVNSAEDRFNLNYHSSPTTPQQATSTTPEVPAALDYRWFGKKVKSEMNGHKQTGAYVSNLLVPTYYRPESTPMVIDTSPEESLSEPSDMKDSHADEELIDQSADDSNGFNVRPDDSGHYTCDECKKVFKHPGSLQHHRHIHKGTHKCPSCGKAFSRRWDMERHLKKSKYGCPANRFPGSDSANVSPSPSPLPIGMNSGPFTPAILTATTHLDLLAAASSRDHNSATV